MNFKNRKIVGFLTALGLFATGSNAQTVEIPPISNLPSENFVKRFEDGSVPEALQYLIDSGVTLTFLGDAGGLLGYLGESPSGSVQTFYLTPDGKHVIAGVLFREGGVNVSGIQLNDMRQRFEQARKSADTASEEIQSLKLGSTVEPNVPNTITEVTPTDIKNGEAQVVTVDSYLSDFGVDEFEKDLDKVAWFSVGSSDAPVLYMLSDPQCPFCHKAWKDLRPMIMSRELSVRVIMVSGLEGSTPKAISILSREEPGRAFFAGEGSTKSMPIAPPPNSSSSDFKRARGYLNTNMAFMEKYNLDATPFFFAFNEEGKLFESRGWPREPDVFFSVIREN